MKRDFELIRTVLLVLEEQAGASGYLAPGEIQGYPVETVAHHFRLLAEARLIEAEPRGGELWFAQRLTWQGHEFLDAIRRRPVWNRMKETLLAHGVDLSQRSLEVATRILLEEVLK